MYLTNPHSGRHPTLYGLIHQQITAVAQNVQHCSAKATTLCHSGHSARGLLSLACAVQADCACRDTPTMCKTRTMLAKTPTWPGDQPGTIHSSDGEPHDLRCDSNCAIALTTRATLTLCHRVSVLASSMPCCFFLACHGSLNSI